MRVMVEQHGRQLGVAMVPASPAAESSSEDDSSAMVIMKEVPIEVADGELA
jgi:hypothetical protein